MEHGHERRQYQVSPSRARIRCGGVFWITRNLSLEAERRGHIIYPIWRAAKARHTSTSASTPRRSSLNAALLRLFGTDLAVIRVSLVLAKAALATMVYLNARLMASRRFALLAYALIVVVWMTPWWVFNSPYANHYSLLLELLGIFIFLTLRTRRFILACAGAGCFSTITDQRHLRFLGLRCSCCG
jgi:hypothetical protein